MFTQRHFIALAKIINLRKEIYVSGESSLIAREALEGLTWDLVELFENDNELFNVKKFIKACGFSEDDKVLTKSRARSDMRLRT